MDQLRKRLISRLRKNNEQRQYAIGLIQRHQQAVADLKMAIVLSDLIEARLVKSEYVLYTYHEALMAAVMDGTWRQR